MKLVVNCSQRKTVTSIVTYSFTKCIRLLSTRCTIIGSQTL